MNLFPEHTQYVFSGKSAIALILRYLRRESVLADKSAQVLVPEWLGTWVYMIMHHYCFPTTTVNKKVQVVMVYHQWGFPQRMETIETFARKHRLFLIEDCAHAITGSYRGKRLGTFGDVSLWSLSKFFGTPAGGALYSKHAKLRHFVSSSISKSDPKLERLALRGLRTGKAEVGRAYAVYNLVAHCPRRALGAMRRALLKGALERRRRNFERLRTALWGPEEERLLEDSEVVPWMVPLFCGGRNVAVAQALEREGFEGGIYHFDVNRNMLKPRFVECIALPCHQGLSKRAIERVIQAVLSARRK